ncbi:MAG: hypothetical protein P1V21_04495 [Rhizobiaceae bacterium]|nr:hypothetical protein [Rhizobiaceae bacterium]
MNLREEVLNESSCRSGPVLGSCFGNQEKLLVLTQVTSCLLKGGLSVQNGVFSHYPLKNAFFGRMRLTDGEIGGITLLARSFIWSSKLEICPLAQHQRIRRDRCSPKKGDDTIHG